ncbi:hypothetical protein V6N13_002394 [Hibiscus sabdariffa]
MRRKPRNGINRSCVFTYEYDHMVDLEKWSGKLIGVGNDYSHWLYCFGDSWKTFIVHACNTDPPLYDKIRAFKSKEADDELENRVWFKASSGPYKWLANFHLDMMAGAVMGGVASNPREQFGVRGWSEKEIGNGSSVLRYVSYVALDFSLEVVNNFLEDEAFCCGM